MPGRDDAVMRSELSMCACSMEEGGCIVRELGCRIRVQLKIQETWTGYPWGKKDLERKCMNPSNESALHHNGNWEQKRTEVVLRWLWPCILWEWGFSQTGVVRGLQWEEIRQNMD